MKRLFLTAASLLLAATSFAQGMFPTQTVTVPDFSASVRTTVDLDSGYTVCSNGVKNRCPSYSYPTCNEFGIKYYTHSVTKNQWAGYSEPAPGIIYNKYICAGTCTARCKVRDEVDPDTHNCPIILDLGQETIRLTSASDGVAFDIDDDGTLDRIAWTVADGDDAFLVADLNGDGVISSGRELFGTKSPQEASDEPHGYKALALYDDVQRGGDGDGWITANDALFPQLQAWIDRDHDGYSDSDELVSLASVGVSAIGIDFTEQRKQDRFGNEFRYRGWVVHEDGSRSKSYDVFFGRE